MPAPKSARGGSHSAVPATKSAPGGSQSAVPATRSAHGGSQSTAPATKSAHEGSQSAAPATKPAHQAPVPSRRQGVHPTPWQAASAAHSTQMLPAERRCPADARAYIRPLGKQQAPHTARKCYRQSAGAQPTPGRTSDPLASSKRRAQHANATGERRCPADARARAYIRPLGKQQAPHTARKGYRQSAGAQPTPGRTLDPHTARKCYTGTSAGAQPTPGRTSDPLASSKRRTQHANATGRAPVPSRRQGVHPTPWQAASAAHDAQMLPAERRRPADAQGVHPTPWFKQQAPHAARKGYRQSAGAQPTPGRTSDPLASSKCRTQHAKGYRRRAPGAHPLQATLGRTQMLPAERRCPADARAYIRPLGKQQAPHTARKCYV